MFYMVSNYIMDLQVAGCKKRQISDGFVASRESLECADGSFPKWGDPNIDPKYDNPENGDPKPKPGTLLLGSPQISLPTS